MLRCLCILILAFFTFSPLLAQDNRSDVFVQAEVDNPAPWFGQQVVYRFRLYDALGLPNSLYQPSDFEGFWHIDFADVTQTVEQVNGRQYTVTEIKTALFPTRPGDLTVLSPVIVLPETVFQPRQELKALPVTLQVQSLPSGAPPDFSGGVGEFQFSVTLDRASITLGEPFTLTLTISGTGDVENLPLPTVALPPTWRISQNPSNYSTTYPNGQALGSKTAQLLIFPDQAGLHTLPIVTLTYFDPLALAYRSINTASIQVEVRPSGISAAPSESSLSPLPASLTLKPITALSMPSPVTSYIVFFILGIIPPLTFISFRFRVWLKRRSSLNQVNHRQARALSSALKNLRLAQNLPPDQSLRRVRHTVFEYIAAKLNTEVSNLGTQDTQTFLTSNGISMEIVKQILGCIELADQALYAPAQSSDVKLLIKRLSDTLNSIDQNWESK